MESVDDLLVFFQLLVSTVTGIELNKVILANQGAPAPEGLYATYNPIPVRAVGHPRKNRTEVPADEYSTDLENWTDYSEKTITQMSFMLSCNIFNSGAKDAAWKLHNANFRYPIQELLYNNQVAWRDCSEVRNLTDLQQASLQPRYQVDINLYIETEVSDTVLKAAGFNFTIVDEDDNTIYDGAS